MTTVETSDPTLAVLQAYAAATAAGYDAQSIANQDLSTSDFMKLLTSVLAKFNGNMKSIEAFLKSFIAHHEKDADKGRASGGSAVALQGASRMLTTLQGNQVKIDALQKKVDAADKEIDNLDKQATAIKEDNDKGFGYWYKYYLKQYGYVFGLGPALIEASAKMAELANAKVDVLVKYTNVKNAQDADKIELAGLQKQQIALTSNTTNGMDSQANKLSAPAHSVIDVANQMLRMSFMFLDLIEKNKE